MAGSSSSSCSETDPDMPELVPVEQEADHYSMFGFGGFGGGQGGGGGFDHGFFPDQNPGRFDHQYQAFPVCFIGKDELEKGNKIVLPSSALDHLARLNISYPMLFEASNPNAARRTHCGVQEFVAEEGTCYLPYWMMTNMCLKEGDLVRITNTSLPKGTYVKLQPVSSDFLNIHNPRAVLENSLRNFATLTVGDCIIINYNSTKYEIEIVECKPSNAISIIEADVNVDFAEPKHMKEPERPAAVPEPAYKPMEEDDEPEEADADKPAAALFVGSGQRIDGKPLKACSPKLGPSKPPVVDEFANMPWKKRILHGIKYTTAPFGFGEGHMTGAKLGTGSKDFKMVVDGVDGGLFGGQGNTIE